jgi:glycosyltransferase involved in cell wall biosynthesis
MPPRTSLALWERFARWRAQRKGRQYWNFPASHRLARSPFFREADVINLHNLHGGYFDFTALTAMAKLKPLVWTLHDSWAITGHCPYPNLYECENWLEGCSACDHLDCYPALRKPTTAKVWKMKENIFSTLQFHIAAPSTWLATQVRKSSFFKQSSLTVIPYGIDLEIFRPVQRESAFEVLGIQPEGNVVLGIAADFADPRKGFREFVDALKIYQSRTDARFSVLFIGEKEREIPELGNTRFSYLGYVSDERLLAAAYSAADVFLMPSLADNLPNVVIEAQACGTPVVAFDVGGIPEIVRHEETGLIVKKCDAESLAGALHNVLGNRTKLGEMSKAARENAVDNFSIELEAKRYIELYEKTLAEKPVL